MAGRSATLLHGPSISTSYRAVRITLQELSPVRSDEVVGGINATKLSRAHSLFDSCY